MCLFGQQQLVLVKAGCEPTSVSPSLLTLVPRASQSTTPYLSTHLCLRISANHRTPCCPVPSVRPAVCAAQEDLSTSIDLSLYSERYIQPCGPISETERCSHDPLIKEASTPSSDSIWLPREQRRSDTGAGQVGCFRWEAQVSLLGGRMLVERPE